MFFNVFAVMEGVVTLVVLYADAAICYILNCFILHVAEIRYHVPARLDDPARDIGKRSAIIVDARNDSRLQAVASLRPYS
jgi:hypothetical protein